MRRLRVVVVSFAALPEPFGARSEAFAKPLVSVDGDAMFGELAIVRWLEKDGWQAFWVDTYHRQQFWRVMPHTSICQPEVWV